MAFHLRFSSFKCTCIILHSFFAYITVVLSIKNSYTKYKWIDGTTIDNSGVSRFSKVYMKGGLSMDGTKLSASAATKLEAVFQHELPQVLSISSNGAYTRNRTYLNATLYKNKRHSLTLKSSLKVNGENIKLYKRSNTIFLKTNADNLMQFRWSEDDDPFLSLTHDNDYTFHMGANTSLLAKYGTTVVPKYITAGSNPIKIPKKTSLVYILGSTGYSNQIKC